MTEKLRILTKQSPTHRWWSVYRAELIIALGGLAAINGIFVSSAFRRSYTVDATAASQLGEFVGGYIGTAFLLLSVLLLIVTLRKQIDSSRQSNFENKYFTLLKLHRANVAELRLGESTGRKVFVLMLRELRTSLPIVRDAARQAGQDLNDRRLMQAAYYCLFYGTGPNSSRMLKAALSDFHPNFIDRLDQILGSEDLKRRIKAARGLGYVPFEGHQSRLGHYYRHLYQTIAFIDQQTIPIDRYEYGKTVRAQLSTHEQALLLLNSLTPIGKHWWDRRFIVDYRMVQNIPRDFFNHQEVDISSLFPDHYFEWEETASRNPEPPGATV